MIDTPDTIRFDPINSIRMLSPRDAHACLTADLAERITAYAWMYLINLPYAIELLARHLEHSHLYALVDARQHDTAQQLTTTHRFFRARQWAANRTQHAKSFIFPDLNATWLITHNITRGAWTMSNNHAVRINSPKFAARALDQWRMDAKHTRQIQPARCSQIIIDTQH